MIFPFMTGILFFNVEPKLIRFAGLFLILGSLFLSGLGKNNDSHGGNWKLLAFIAFLITGVVQNLVNLPSYFESTQNVTPIYRTFTLALGVFTMAVIHTWHLRKKIAFKKNLSSRWLWGFNIILQLIGLTFAVVLQYPAMDTLAKCGAGSLSYPLMVGSCLVGFSCYSMFILKEESTPLQKGAFVCCLAGIIMICL
jgi:multidrug transporter EmrE-like cation transporter